MKDMKSKNNQSETSNEFKQGGGSKWLLIILGIIALVGGLSYGLKLKSINTQQFEGLVEDIEYHVLEVEQVDSETAIHLEMNGTEDEVVEVMQAVIEEVKQNTAYNEGDKIAVDIYEDLDSVDVDTKGESETEVELIPEAEGNLPNKNPEYVGIYEETLKVYQFKDFSDVEANIEATSDWKIENSRFEEGHLVGEVFLLEEYPEEVIYSQLKALESEMIRFNEVEEEKHTYFYTPQVEQVSYGYSSVYPDYLIIEKEYTITHTK